MIEDTSESMTARVKRWWRGRPRPDGGHRPSLAVVAGPGVLPAGARGRFEVEIVNESSAVWPPTSPAGSGPVIHLSYHWQDLQGAVVVWDGLRSSLPVDVVPGQRLSVSLDVLAPSVPGPHTLLVDLVDESAGWFAIDHSVGCTIEPGVRDELLSYAPGVVPIDTALAQRGRLDQPDALDAAFGHPEVERVDGLTFGEWALDRVTVDYLVSSIRADGVRRILEFGSGSSTVALATEAAACGGRVLSVDQDESYAAQTRRQLADRGLDARATVITAPLADVEACGVTTRCYDLSGDVAAAIASLSPELVLIDGPSLPSGGSRVAVVPQLVPMLGGVVAFAMDDAFRDAELSIATRWDADPAIVVDGILPMGKGLLVGHFIGSGSMSKRDERESGDVGLSRGGPSR